MEQSEEDKLYELEKRVDFWQKEAATYKKMHADVTSAQIKVNLLYAKTAGELRAAQEEVAELRAEIAALRAAK